jgi:hypothetical protein
MRLNDSKNAVRGTSNFQVRVDEAIAKTFDICIYDSKPTREFHIGTTHIQPHVVAIAPGHDFNGWVFFADKDDIVIHHTHIKR